MFREVLLIPLRIATEGIVLRIIIIQALFVFVIGMMILESVYGLRNFPFSSFAMYSELSTTSAQ